jgi:hypothetical protein
VAVLTIEQPSPYGDVSDAVGWLLGVVAKGDEDVLAEISQLDELIQSG